MLDVLPAAVFNEIIPYPAVVLLPVTVILPLFVIVMFPFSSPVNLLSP